MEHTRIMKQARSNQSVCSLPIRSDVSLQSGKQTRDPLTWPAAGIRSGGSAKGSPGRRRVLTVQKGNVLSRFHATNTRLSPKNRFPKAYCDGQTGQAAHSTESLRANSFGRIMLDP